MTRANVTHDSLPQRCARIEMLVLDVDGVLTDGRIVYSDRGEETMGLSCETGGEVDSSESASAD